MSRRRSLEQGSLFALSLLPLMMAASGAAAQHLPSGGVVTAGEATIGYTSANAMTIGQTSAKAIIEWGDFSIGAGQSVTFNNGTGATLNRASGWQSNIAGALTGTGSVYLINPKGVIIGATGTVNVGGSFVASTLDVADGAFLVGGPLTFEQQSSASAFVRNFGQIGALGGDVVLMAVDVRNEGVITAGGTAALAAGRKVLMRDARLNDGRFVVEVGGGDVTNLGAITATEVELRANNGAIYALAGNTTGMINAGDVTNASVLGAGYSGRVFLTAGTGNVTATGGVSSSDSVIMQGATVDVADAQIRTGTWTIDADSFAIGDGEAAALARAMTVSLEAGPDDFQGTNVSITAHAGDIVLNVVESRLDFGDRELRLTASGNVTLNGLINGVAYHYQDGGMLRRAAGSLYLRSDSAGVGEGVVTVGGMGTGNVHIITNVDNYANGAAAYSNLGDSVSVSMLVNSYADLARIATDNEFNAATGNFLLSHDIDASASSAGDYVGATLTGVFDGGDHTISDLNLMGSDVGLFQAVTGAGASVQNLSLTGSLSGTGVIGAVTSRLDAGTISNVHSTMTVNDADDINNIHNMDDTVTGGLVGSAVNGVISDSSVGGAVTGLYHVGGLVGKLQGGRISGSTVSGAVGGVNYVGGLVARATGGVIGSNLVTGDVEGNTMVGGVAGYVEDMRVENNAASGAVDGQAYLGGLIGYSQGVALSYSTASGDVTGWGDYVGGLIGLEGTNISTISHTDASGAVSGVNNVGGLIGGLIGGQGAGGTTVTDSHATGAVTGSQTSIGGLVGKADGGDIQGSWATGAVTGGAYVGGLVGAGLGTAMDTVYATGLVSGVDIISTDGGLILTDVGGLIGYASNATVTNAWASGGVGGGGDNGRTFGGLIGLANGGAYSNLHASGNVTGQNQVGGLIGFTGGGLTLSDSYATGKVTGGYSANQVFEHSEGGTGGLIGYADRTQVTNAYATGVVTGVDNTGGLVGRLAAYVDLTRVWASGTVYGLDYTGGLVGAINGLEGGNTVGQSYAEGAVSGQSSVGGLIGGVTSDAQSWTNIQDVYALGAVVGTATDVAGSGDNIGGLIGLVGGSTDVGYVYATGSVSGNSGVGGLVGNLRDGAVHDGYATGWVTGASGLSATGGLIGLSDGGALGNLHWDADTSGQAYADNTQSWVGGASDLHGDSAFHSYAYNFVDNGKWVFLDGLRPLLASEASYTINNVHELQLIGLHSSGSYTLGRDVSAAETSAGGGSVFGANGFVPIDTFSGELQGAGHRISGLTIVDAGSYVGLFRTISGGAIVNDLALIGGAVRATDLNNIGVGALAGYNGSSQVSNIASTVAVSASNRGYYAGGLIGNNVGTITNVAARGDVSGYLVGGVAGHNTGSIINAVSSGALTGSNALGGIVGVNEGGVIDTALVTSGMVFLNPAGAIAGQIFGGTITNARWSTTVLDPLSYGEMPLFGGGYLDGVSNNHGYSTAELQDQALFSTVYAGFDSAFWAPGSAAEASSDGQAHFAELYRADNVVLIDARASREYGETVSFTLPPQGDLRDGDIATEATVTGDDASYNVGTYRLAVTGGGMVRHAGGAYRTVTLDTLTVTPRTLTVAFSGGVVKTYDGTSTIALDIDAFSVANVVNGQDVQVRGLGYIQFHDTNTGQYFDAAETNDSGGAAYNLYADLSLSGFGAGNYRLAASYVDASNTAYINRAIATATVSDSKIYDGTSSLGGAADIHVSGLVDSSSSFVDLGLVYADKNVGEHKAVVDDGTTDLSATNYALSSFDFGRGVITAKTITAGLTGSVTKVYDGVTAATLDGNLELTGLVEGDAVAVGSTGAAYADKAAGTGKTVTASSLSLSGADHGNYVLASTTTSGSVGVISAKTIAAGLTGTVTKIYDGATAAALDGNLELTGLIEGDTVAVGSTSAAYGDKTAATGKTVTASGLSLSGADHGNYVLASTTTSGAVGVISAKAVAAGLSGSVTKVYDGATAATFDGNLELTGLIEGDTVAVGSTGAAYADKAAGTGKTVTASGLSLSGDDAGNYVLASTTASGSIGVISAKTIAAGLSGSVTKVYDGASAATLGDNLSLTGLIEGDTVAVGSTSAAYGDKTAATGKTVTASGLSLSGADHGNYVLASTTASGSIGVISAKTIAAGLSGSVTKVYDGSTAATLGDNLALTGLVDGDTVNVGLTSAAYADKNVGTGKTVTANGLSLSGNDAGNYVLASTTASGAVGVIRAKAIAAGLSGSVTKVYDGSTAATLGDNLALTGLVDGDTVNVGSTSAAYADKNAGTAKTVTASGLSLSGDDAGNYVLASITASGTIGRIDAKTVAVGLTGAVAKVYDGTTAATLGDNLALTGLVAGDMVTVAGTGSAYGDKNAATGKAVIVNGVSLGGSDAGNYVLASTTASANVGVISQKALTITADNQVKNRNDLDPTLTYVSTGLVTGDGLTGALTRDAGETVETYGITQGTLSGGGNYAITYNRAVLTINLGIPPVEDLIIPYVPAESSGTATAGSPNSNAAGQANAGTSTGYRLAVQDQTNQSQQQQQSGDDTTTCAAGEACTAAPYAQGGSTSGAIHFQGFTQ